MFGVVDVWTARTWTVRTARNWADGRRAERFASGRLRIYEVRETTLPTVKKEKKKGTSSET